MAGSSLFALLDDIATLLDDVAILTKVAAKKTAGVLGDDLALNAQQVTGVHAERELPVVWAVAKGSFVNKVILVPLALLLSLIASWAIMPLLMIGGAYLCFEGFEKLAHKFLHSKSEDEQHHKKFIQAVSDQDVDLIAFEKDKIKGAIRTDFVLSAEIIVISLGAVATAAFATQAAVVVSIAILMTVGVYGLVALIVKLDDIGERLIKNTSRVSKIVGKTLLLSAPKLMRLLSVLGTAAMFLVGGDIVTHGIEPVHHAFEHWAAMAGSFDWLASTLLKMIAGVLVGALVLLMWTLIGRFLPKKA